MAAAVQRSEVKAGHRTLCCWRVGWVELLQKATHRLICEVNASAATMAYAGCRFLESSHIRCEVAGSDRGLIRGDLVGNDWCFNIKSLFLEGLSLHTNMKPCT